MRKYFQYILTLAGLFIVWQIVSMIIGSYALPGPVTVLQKLADDARSFQYWRHIGTSVYRITAALAIAFVIAVPLGLFLGMSPRTDRLAKPLIYLSYPIPKIVLLPIVLLIFGLGDMGKIVMLAMILFFQLLITTRDAARGVSREALFTVQSGRHEAPSVQACCLAVMPSGCVHVTQDSDRHGRGGAFLCRIDQHAVRHGLLYSRCLGTGRYSADICRDDFAGRPGGDTVRII